MESPPNPFVLDARPRGLRRWIPGLAIVDGYSRATFARDVAAGLALTAGLVPVGMGYATAAGLPAINGLYATIVPLVAYAVFGPSRILVLGPDSALAALFDLAASTGIAVVGSLPRGLPAFQVQLAAPDQWGRLAAGAAAIALVSFTEMKGPVKDRLKKYGLFTKLGTGNFFPTLGQAVDRYLEVHPVEWRDWDE